MTEERVRGTWRVDERTGELVEVPRESYLDELARKAELERLVRSAPPRKSVVS